MGAIGTAVNGLPRLPLALHWNGTAWSQVTVPTGNNTALTAAPAVHAGLNAVFALSATNIWAVGDSVLNPDGTKTALILHFDGSTGRPRPTRCRCRPTSPTAGSRAWSPCPPTIFERSVR